MLTDANTYAEFEALLSGATFQTTRRRMKRFYLAAVRGGYVEIARDLAVWIENTRAIDERGWTDMSMRDLQISWSALEFGILDDAEAAYLGVEVELFSLKGRLVTDAI